MLKSCRLMARSAYVSCALAALFAVATVPSYAAEEAPAAGSASADSGGGGTSADEVAKKLANPNNDLAKLTFKNQYRWYTGDLPGADDQDNYTLLFQPIFPFSMGETKSGGHSVLFVRPAIPLVVNQPVPGLKNGQLNWDDETALGDIGFDIAYGVTEKNGFLWALGMTGTLPTATDNDVAGGQLRLGPELLVAKLMKKGVIGVFPSHQWDVGGWKDTDYSTTSIQPLLILTPGNGWQIAYKPIMTYDWEGEQWTVPVGPSIAKTIMVGNTPLQIEVEAQYYVEQPDEFGPDWFVGINFTPVIPNFIEKMFKK